LSDQETDELDVASLEYRCWEPGIDHSLSVLKTSWKGYGVSFAEDGEMTLKMQLAADPTLRRAWKSTGARVRFSN